VTKIEELKEYIAIQQGNADSILAAQNASKAAEKLLSDATQEKQVVISEIANARLELQKTQKRLEEAKAKAEAAEKASSDEVAPTKPTEEEASQSEKEGESQNVNNAAEEVKRLTEELKQAETKHASAKAEAKIVSKALVTLKKKSSEGLGEEALADHKKEIEISTKKKEAALKALYDATIQKVKLSTALKKTGVESGAAAEDSKGSAPKLGPLKQLAFDEKTKYEKMVLEEKEKSKKEADFKANAELINERANEAQSQLNHSKHMEVSLMNQRKEIDVVIGPILAAARDAKRDWLGLEEFHTENVKLLKQAVEYLPKLPLVETKYSEVSQELFKT